MDDNINLPKTSSKIMFEHYYEQASLTTQNIEKLGVELPEQIAKAVLKNIEQSLNESKAELIRFTNDYKDYMGKEHTSYKHNLLTAINNNANAISNAVNNHLLLLACFGLFCGVCGGLVAYCIQLFLK
jgi:uncharacterized protein YdiU (UPF0061 family)